MGTQIKDVANVSISKENARITRAGFGTAIFVGYDNRTDERVRIFSEPSELLDSNYQITDEVYKSAVSHFSQELSPERFMVGRIKADSNCLQRITLDDAPTAGTFTITLGTETTATIDYDATAAEIKSALELLTAITEVTIVGTAQDEEFTVEFTGSDANTDFSLLEVNVASLAGVSLASVNKDQFGSAVEDWTTGLNAIKEENNEWYAMLMTDDTLQNQKDTAIFIETLSKLLFIDSSESSIPTSGESDIAFWLKDRNYSRTAIIYSTDATTYPSAGWTGGQLPKTPGSITWVYKPIVGTSPDDLSTTQIGYLQSKNCNYFENIGGKSVVSWNGIVSSGEYIDVMRGVDWIEARMSENVFDLLTSADKVPYTNAGIQLVVDRVRQILVQAVANGIINDDYVINYPTAEVVSKADKSTRLLQNISFSATLQGAVHTVKITGKVSV